MANQHIGTGLLTGTLNGLETDEEGNISFNPAKFVAGFAGGSLASKIGLDTIKRLSKYPRAREIFNKLENEKLVKAVERNQNKDIITRSNFDKGERMKLDKFLNKNRQIDKEKLLHYAAALPKIKINSTADFKAQFKEKKGRFGFIQTPYKVVKVDMPYAYAHFYNNTSGANRGLIKSAFFETFINPLFIAKNNSKGKESVYFYKPFYDENENIFNLFGIGIDGQGKVDFKTFYKDISGSRFKEMLNLADENIIYVKE